MIFTYWSGDGGAPAEAVKSWLTVHPDFRVFGDDDMRRALEPRGAPAVDLVDRIRIPAARSDVARLALLWAHGGIYVDAHVGSDDAAATLDVALRLVRRDVVAFTKPRDGGRTVTNAVLAGRRSSSVIGAVLDRTLDALNWHRIRERASHQHVPYHLHELTGPKHLEAEIIGSRGSAPTVKPELVGSVDLVDLAEGGGSGFASDLRVGRRDPEQHWTRRQDTEKLFEV